MMSTYLLRIAGGKQDVPNALKRFRVGFLELNARTRKLFSAISIAAFD